MSTKLDIRSKDDLVPDQLPNRAPLLRSTQSIFDPLLLDWSDDAALRVDIHREVLHVIDVIAQVGDVTVPFPRVQRVNIEQVAKPKVSPDFTLLSKIYLSNWDPLEIRPLSMERTVGETDRVVRIGTSASFHRIVRV